MLASLCGEKGEGANVTQMRRRSQGTAAGMGKLWSGGFAGFGGGLREGRAIGREAVVGGMAGRL